MRYELPHDIKQDAIFNPKYSDKIMILNTMNCPRKYCANFIKDNCVLNVVPISDRVSNLKKLIKDKYPGIPIEVRLDLSHAFIPTQSGLN